jgi:hypothetical protein
MKQEKMLDDSANFIDWKYVVVQIACRLAHSPTTDSCTELSETETGPADSEGDAEVRGRKHIPESGVRGEG